MAMHRSAGLGTCRAAGNPAWPGTRSPKDPTQQLAEPSASCSRMLDPKNHQDVLHHPKIIKMCCEMPNTSQHPKCPRAEDMAPGWVRLCTAEE